jgi:hypothetical protein
MSAVLNRLIVFVILTLTACGSLTVQGDVIPAAKATSQRSIALASGELQVTGQPSVSTAASQPTATDTPGVPETIPTGNWISLGLETEQIAALAIDPATPTTLYAGVDAYGGGNKGVFKSTDGGTSWVNTGPDTGCVQALAIDPTMPTTLYAGTLLDGVFKSTDGGASWTNTGSLLGAVKTLMIDPSTSTTLYAETYNVAAGGLIGVFKSVDSGENWNQISSGTLDPPIDPTVSANLNDQPHPFIGIEILVADPTAPNTLYAATWYDNVNTISSSDGGVYKSTDGGASWVNLGLTRTLIRALVIDPAIPTTLYAGTDSGVFVIHQAQ